MNFEDNFFEASSENGSLRRTSSAAFSLYDTNSRDSGFDDICSESFGDDFLEEFAEINYSENVQLPTDFSNLIQKPIVTVTINERPTFRKAISLEEHQSPLKKRLCQRNQEDAESNDFLIRKKKLIRKSRTEEPSNAVVPLRNCFSSEDIIKTALQRSYSEPDLIADFSRGYSLPLSRSRHQDLRAIDTSTLRSLLHGEYSAKIENFTIIDCRYPYEYNGGHIEGAINMYTYQQCASLLEDAHFSENTGKSNILIFHCEFSLERGPNLYRYLRQEDRRLNSHRYPYLRFPEIYILEGGYRKFFEENSCMCSPKNYTQMLDPQFTQELIFFRHTSNTCNADIKASSKKNMLRARNW